MTAGTVNAIEAENLTRTYRDVVAVDGVDLVIPRGELFGLVGPDGAGKSTLIRMLATVIEPTSGDARVLGDSIVLSGFMFPVDSMPALIKPITYLIPLRYFLVVIRSIFLKGAGPVALWPQLAAMAVFSVVIFGFALLRFQKKFSD